MRSLQRNKRQIYYAIPEGTEPIVDEYGNDTLEVRSVYSWPEALDVNVSANVGQEAVDTFGLLSGYHRTITYFGGNCPLVDGTRIWFGVDPEGPHNYVVIKVADSKNGYQIALREVSDRG